MEVSAAIDSIMEPHMDSVAESRKRSLDDGSMEIEEPTKKQKTSMSLTAIIAFMGQIFGLGGFDLIEYWRVALELNDDTTTFDAYDKEEKDQFLMCTSLRDSTIRLGCEYLWSLFEPHREALSQLPDTEPLPGSLDDLIDHVTMLKANMTQAIQEQLNASNTKASDVKVDSSSAIDDFGRSILESTPLEKTFTPIKHLKNKLKVPIFAEKLQKWKFLNIVSATPLCWSKTNPKVMAKKENGTLACSLANVHKKEYGACGGRSSLSVTGLKALYIAALKAAPTGKIMSTLVMPICADSTSCDDQTCHSHPCTLNPPCVTFQLGRGFLGSKLDESVVKCQIMCANSKCSKELSLNGKSFSLDNNPLLQFCEPVDIPKWLNWDPTTSTISIRN